MLRMILLDLRDSIQSPIEMQYTNPDREDSMNTIHWDMLRFISSQMNPKDLAYFSLC